MYFLFCDQLFRQLLHLCLRCGTDCRTDGDDVLTDGNVLHALQFGAHELGGHGGPGAVLHQADGAALEVLGLQVGQQVFHRREEETIIGGTGQHDLAAAESLGIRAERALGLPGRFAPKTAGEIVKETVLNILSEREEDDCG